VTSIVGVPAARGETADLPQSAVGRNTRRLAPQIDRSSSERWFVTMEQIGEGACLVSSHSMVERLGAYAVECGEVRVK
jgi:hypothetical protein